MVGEKIGERKKNYTLSHTSISSKIQDLNTSESVEMDYANVINLVNLYCKCSTLLKYITHLPCFVHAPQ